MFEKNLAESFSKIFDVKKVSFAEPGEVPEQKCMFINVENAVASIKDSEAVFRVTGTAFMFADNTNLPFGFFAKQIAKAKPALTKPFFFHDMDTNTRNYQNIVQRGFSFVYNFAGQYDPDNGSMTEVEFTFEETL